MRATISRKEFTEWVEHRLESDNGFTIDFFHILNWFEQGEIKSIPRLPITKMLMVTALVARIKLYPVKAVSMEQYMKHLITWEWDDVSLLPEAVQEALPTIYVPRQATTVPRSI